MRFFRGLAVPSNGASDVINDIKENGIYTNAWCWHSGHFKPNPNLLGKAKLSLQDTRPKNRVLTPAVCACGDLSGALYYAWHHNMSELHNTPVIVEFECPSENAAIDGRDLLYTVFQMGAPDRATSFVSAAFGEKGLSYAQLAWQTKDQGSRIAICDLMIHDNEVVKAHHRNRMVIAGRHGTLFRSAFTIALPINAISICNVYTPDKLPEMPQPDVNLDQLLER